MSIIIKANELNTLIYKYFLEAGLSHSAYSLFNEASLAQPLQEFRFDVRAGHLLNLLEKGLIYNKIQAHVNVNEYTDCEQPFSLLKPHTCKLVEKIRSERNKALKSFQQSLNEGIRRTNSIYNTAIANEEVSDIVYDPKGGRYFQKFAKIRLPANQGETQNVGNKFILKGSDQNILLYNADDYQLDLLKYDNINEEVKVQRIFPSLRQGQLVRSIDEAITNHHLIQLFDGNQVTLFDLKDQNTSPIEFSLPSTVHFSQIMPNPNIPQLICFKNQHSFCVVNLNTFKVALQGQGKYFWRSFDEYLIIGARNIKLRSISDDQDKIVYQSEIEWQNIQFNSEKTLFAAVSYSSHSIHIYTFDCSTPLFTFYLQDQSKALRQTLFVTSGATDYFCWLTSGSVTVFDISLNSYSKIIAIQDFDTEIRQICVLRKGQKEENYLLCLGFDHLVVYDLNLSKIERIELQSKVYSLSQLGGERVAMLTDSQIFFLVGQYIDPLFK